MTRILSVVGARPQFVKVAPILRAITDYNAHATHQVEHILIHTGQHYDYELSQAFFVDLDLPQPDRNLGVGSGSHGKQTGEMLKKIEQVLVEEEPDVVLVYGDTNSTLAAALAAVKLHIPIAHVEAGLREQDKRIPEEVNRILTDHVSTILFCPSRVAVENLQREGLGNVASKGRLVPENWRPVTLSTAEQPLVVNTGDVMADALFYNVKLAEACSSILSRLGLLDQWGSPREYLLATVHRAENTDESERLRSIFSAFGQLARDGNAIVLPLHPRTRKVLAGLSDSEALMQGLRIVDPVPYLDMLMLEKNARAILTDSGGMQKEAFWLEVPCVTLRDVTGWEETVEAGWNRLVGWQSERIVEAFREIKPGVSGEHPYGDGRATQRIVRILAGSSK